MRFKTTTSFTLLRNRTYVHSSQIFDLLLHQLSMRSGEIGPNNISDLTSFKFARETNRNGRCVLAPDKEIELAEAASTITIEIKDERHTLAFFDDGDIADSGTDDLMPTIKSTEKTGAFEGIVVCDKASTPLQQFANLIEANKALHNLTLNRDPVPAYRFVFAENIPINVETDNQHTLHYKLLDNRHRGDNQFTLIQVSIAGHNSTAPIRLCFSY